MPSNECSFILSEDDFIAAQRLHFRRALTVRSSVKWFALVSILVAALIFVIDGAIDPVGFLFALLVMFAAFVALLLLLWLSIPIFARRTLKQRKIGGPVALSWDASGFRMKSEYGEANFAWSDLYRWAADRAAILLFIDERIYYALPRRAFDRSAAENLIAALKSAGIQQR